MKGVDEFLWVLLAAVVFMVILIAVSGFVPPAGTGVVAPGVPGVSETLANFSLGTIGYTVAEPVSTFSIGSFTAGEAQKESLKSLSNLELSASVLGPNVKEFAINVPEGMLSDIRSVEVGFSVRDTNMYGEFVVEWNGKEFHRSRLGKGQHAITIGSQYVKDKNILKVYTTGPGLMFWAHAVYLLTNFEVSQVYGLSKIVPFRLFPSDLSGFDRGEVSFTTVSKTSGGTLAILVNGVEVYNKHPERDVLFSFVYTDAPLKSGNNLLTFTARDGKFSLEDATFRLFLFGNRVSKRKDFELTASQHDMLKQGVGRVNIYISSVPRTGTLTVSINQNETSLRIFDSGWVAANFTSQDVSPGSNELSFSGTGTFDIPQVEVIIKR